MSEEKRQYCLQHLPSLLGQSLKWSELSKVLCDLDFLHHKVKRGMATDLISDYETAISKIEEAGGDRESRRSSSRMVNRFATAFNQEFHGFHRNQSVAAQQLYNRMLLSHRGDPEIEKLLQSFREEGGGYPEPGTWLRCLGGTQNGSIEFLARIIPGHDHAVQCASISASGKLAASGDRNGIVRIWRIADGKPMHVFQAHSDRVASLAWDPENMEDEILFTAGWDRLVKKWEVRFERSTLSFQVNTEELYAMALLPGSREVAIVSESNAVSVWSVVTGEFSRKFHGHTERVRCICVDPSGKTLVTGSDDRTVRVWNLEKPGIRFPLRAHLAGIRAVAIDIDGEMVASGADDGTVILWDAVTGKLIHRLEGSGSRIIGLAFHSRETNMLYQVPTDDPIGQMYLISVSEDQSMRIWNCGDKKPLNVLYGTTNGPSFLICNWDGSITMTGGVDGLVKLWKDLDWELESERWREHNAEITAIKFNAAKNRVISGAADGIIRVWSAEDCAHVMNLRGHIRPVTNILPLGNHFFASGGLESKIKVWSIADGRFVQDLGEALSESLRKGRSSSEWKDPMEIVSCLASPDNYRIFSAGNARIRIWNAESGTEISTLAVPHGIITQLVVDLSTSRIIAGGSNPDIFVWDLKSGDYLGSLSGHQNSITALAISKGRLISSSRDGSVRVWDVLEKKELCRALEAGTWTSKFIADTQFQTIIAARTNGTLLKRDISTLEPIHEIPAHAGPLTVMELDQKSGRLFSASGANELKVWNSENLESVGFLKTEAAISSLCITGGNSFCLGTRTGMLALYKIEESSL